MKPAPKLAGGSGDPPLRLSLIHILALGVPIAISLGAASVIVLITMGNMPLTMVVQLMYTSMNSFVMVAVPLFILAGSLMDEGGIADKIYDLAEACVGWIYGGLGHVAILCNIIFGAMSGSSVAAVEMCIRDRTRVPPHRISSSLSTTSKNLLKGECLRSIDSPPNTQRFFFSHLRARIQRMRWSRRGSLRIRFYASVDGVAISCRDRIRPCRRRRPWRQTARRSEPFP